MSKTMYADVAPAIPLPLRKAQTYTYKVPAGTKVHSLATIPFGRRRVPGTILKLHAQKKLPYSVKHVDKIFDASLTAEQVLFAEWIARTMQGGLGFTLRLFTPPARGAAPKKEPSLPRLRQLLQEMLPQKKGVIIEKNDQKRLQHIWRLCQAALAEGGQALILVPETNMVEQVLKSMPLAGKSKKLVFPYHGGLKKSQMGQVWHRLRSGAPTVVVGTQKALFLPFQSLRLIIIEEEQYNTHKLWDQYPRLHNGYAAGQLARVHGACIVHASSFPSLRLWHSKQDKNVSVLSNEPPIFRTAVIAPSFEDRKKKHIFPEEFTGKLRSWMKKKERVLVLYNQRGAWQVAKCRSCKTNMACPECKVSLAVHGAKSDRELICHQCGFQQEVPKTCPVCKKGSLKFFGIGTQIVEKILQQLHPFSNQLYRVDADTVQKESPASLKRKVSTKQLIIGTAALLTQAQGKQFDRVVWLFPERSWRYPDYRSYERSLVMLARLQKLAKNNRSVVLVTKAPQELSEVIPASIEKAYEKQIKERRRLFYPPFSDMVRLTVRSKKEEDAFSLAENLRKHIEKRHKAQAGKMVIRGPFQGFIPVRRGKAEAHVLLLGEYEYLAKLYQKLPVDIADLEPSRIM